MAKSDDGHEVSSSKKPATPKAVAKKHPSSASTAAGKDKAKKKPKPVRLDSPRWLVPLMLALFGIGLIWIVVYYVAPDAPFVKTLGWWNVVIGFAFLAGGFIASTKWK